MRFKIDKAACADFSRDELARQVGASESADPEQIALAYRRFVHLKAPIEVLDAMEAGCLAGILEGKGRG